MSYIHIRQVLLGLKSVGETGEKREILKPEELKEDMNLLDVLVSLCLMREKLTNVAAFELITTQTVSDLAEMIGKYK